jgi:hypothetical protein
MHEKSNLSYLNEAARLWAEGQRPPENIPDERLQLIDDVAHSSDMQAWTELQAIHVTATPMSEKRWELFISQGINAVRDDIREMNAFSIEEFDACKSLAHDIFQERMEGKIDEHGSN